ncbi:MAG: tripartite tricarboxylate transporter substrate binding protein, partial [Alcaligenaceae bacterium]
MAKRHSRREFLVTSASLAGASAFGLSSTLALAQEQAWPAKTIRIIVPFPAGSSTDTMARLLADYFSKALKQAVVVENKGGANGSIGATEVARSAPDGYTLLATNSSSITVNPLIYKNSQYKSADFAPIALVLDAPFILNVNPAWAEKNSINSVKDLVAFAKKNPNELTYGSGGQGNLAHLAFALLSNEAQFKATHVPYKSAAQASTAVMAGEVNIMPPGSSRWPVSRFSTLMSHRHKPPNSCVDTPTRPYSAARDVPANSRVSRRSVSGSIPVSAAIRSGVYPATASRSVSR